MTDFTILPYVEADWPECWQLLQAVFKEGTTYPYGAETSETDAQTIWIRDKTGVFVVRDQKSHAFLGTYFLKPNQACRGAHVCNCGYITAPTARGRGIATQMCLHSQVFAVESGFSAMQFNFVVATNKGAVRLWQKLGFSVIGTLPGVFDHPEHGYVDAHVMFKQF